MIARAVESISNLGVSGVALAIVAGIIVAVFIVIVRRK